MLSSYHLVVYLFRKHKLFRLHNETGNYHAMCILNARLFLNPCATPKKVNGGMCVDW